MKEVNQSIKMNMDGKKYRKLDSTSLMMNFGLDISFIETTKLQS